MDLQTSSEKHILCERTKLRSDNDLFEVISRRTLVYDVAVSYPQADYPEDVPAFVILFMMIDSGNPSPVQFTCEHTSSSP